MNTATTDRRQPAHGVIAISAVTLHTATAWVLRLAQRGRTIEILDRYADRVAVISPPGADYVGVISMTPTALHHRTGYALRLIRLGFVIAIVDRYGDTVAIVTGPDPIRSDTDADAALERMMSPAAA